MAALPLIFTIHVIGCRVQVPYFLRSMKMTITNTRITAVNPATENSQTTTKLGGMSNLWTCTDSCSICRYTQLLVPLRTVGTAAGRHMTRITIAVTQQDSVPVLGLHQVCQGPEQEALTETALTFVLRSWACPPCLPCPWLSACLPRPWPRLTTNKPILLTQPRTITITTTMVDLCTSLTTLLTIHNTILVWVVGVDQWSMDLVSEPSRTNSSWLKLTIPKEVWCENNGYLILPE